MAVVALEELIGNHGGLGGEQTDAFIFHLGEMEVTETTQFDRRLPYPEQRPRQAGRGGTAGGKAEKGGRLGAARPDGRARAVARWHGLALRCMTLTQRLQQVVDNPYMTGPALFIGIVKVLITALAHRSGNLLQVASSFVARMLAVAWYLQRAGCDETGVVTKTMAVVGCAQRSTPLVPRSDPSVWARAEPGNRRRGCCACGWVRRSRTDARVAHRVLPWLYCCLRHRRRHCGDRAGRRAVYRGRPDGESRRAGQVRVR